MTEDRDAALSAAADAVCGRDDNHGDPARNFQTIADLWNAYLRESSSPLEPYEVAEMMTLLKVARSVNGQPAFDHHVDICGYGTLAAYLVDVGGKADD